MKAYFVDRNGQLSADKIECVVTGAMSDGSRVWTMVVDGEEVVDEQFQVVIVAHKKYFVKM